MKFGNKKLVGLLTAGAILLTMPVQSGASTGITAGISQKIAANIETVAGGNAGVSSALASCMDAEIRQGTLRKQPRERRSADIPTLASPR